MLASLADLKTILGITGSLEDARLTLFLEESSAMIESYCRRKFAVHTRTDFLRGNDTDVVLTREGPVRSIANLWYDPSGYFGRTDAFGAETLLTQGVDYRLIPDQPDGATSWSGRIQRIYRTWPGSYRNDYERVFTGRDSASGNIKVTYDCGFDVVPADVQGACRRIASRLYYLRGGMPVQSESFRDYSYSLALTGANKVTGDSAVLTPDITAVLDYYRTLRIGRG